MRRVSVMNSFYEESLHKDEPQVSVYISADIPRAILTEHFVFILYLSILPNIQVENYSNYSVGDLSQWYNDIKVVGKIRYKYLNMYLIKLKKTLM